MTWFLSIQSIPIFLAASLLAACTGPAPVIDGRTETDLGRPRPTDAECELYRSATESLSVSERRAEPSILAGCPGRFANYAPSDAEKQRYQLTAADTNAVPSTVSEAGVGQRRLFQRLLVRGVPVDVAVQLSGTEEFRALAVQMES